MRGNHVLLLRCILKVLWDGNRVVKIFHSQAGSKYRGFRTDANLLKILINTNKKPGGTFTVICSNPYGHVSQTITVRFFPLFSRVLAFRCHQTCASEYLYEANFVDVFGNRYLGSVEDNFTWNLPKFHHSVVVKSNGNKVCEY